MMRKFVERGLMGGLMTVGAIAGCGDTGKESTPPPSVTAETNAPAATAPPEAGLTGVTVTVQAEHGLYEQPNVINDPTALTGTLRVGELATVVCYFESATLAADSVGVTASRGAEHMAGFALIFDRGPKGDKVVNHFDIDAEQLHDMLPSCTAE
jgi:hypothetical protein